MRSLVVTDNSVEKIEIKDWGERLAIFHTIRTGTIVENHPPLILSPGEAEKIARFILNIKGGQDAKEKI